MTGRFVRQMVPRDVGEAHRASSPLELLFDLCFVVAVAAAAGRLHHALVDHPGLGAVGHFAMVFFAIWWAWMNFTWFASSFDTDDVLYRITTLVQIAGALVLAAGVARAFDHDDLGVMTLGYVVMRSAIVAQWLRAAAGDASVRRGARRYALGVSVVELGWVLNLLLPGSLQPVGWAVLVVGELSVPVWAERAGVSSWHAGHIVERYGLFTLIVLGESILAATTAVQSAAAGGDLGEVATIAVGGLLIVFSMWWLYFDRPAEELLGDIRAHFEESQARSFVWGYGHLLVFAAAAAVGAGLQAAVDVAVGHGEHLGERGAGLAVAIPVAVYLCSLWVLQDGSSRTRLRASAPIPAVAVAVVLSTLVGESVLTIGVLLAGLVAWIVARGIAPPAELSG